MPITKRKFFNYFMLTVFAVIFVLIGMNLQRISEENKYSQVFTDYQKDKTNYKVNFSERMVEELNSFFNEEKEFRVCLKGYIKEKTIFIDEYSKYKTGTNKSVQWSHCDGYRELGLLHSHPNGMDYPSHADLYCMFLGYRKYDNKIQVIMYDYSKFVVLTEKNWRYGKKLDFS